MQNHPNVDSESQAFFSVMGEQERLRSRRIPGVRTVLVVLSSAGMVYDLEALQQKIRLGYPEATVHFMNTRGESIGLSAPSQIDLLIDFTGPGQRQSLFLTKKLRRRARVAIGRNVGIFRKRIYDRVFDEKAVQKSLPTEKLDREQVVQKEVLSLAGIALVQAGDAPADLGKVIALGLPPMARL